MATKWTSPVWRMPENSNQSKLDNYSLDFDGTNDFIDLSTGLDYFDYETGGYTTSCWIKWTGTVYNKKIMNFGANNFKFSLWQAPTNSGNSISVQLNKGGGQKLILSGWSRSGVTLNDGNWHHIGIVIRQNTGPTYVSPGGQAAAWAGLFDIYIDGSNLTTGTYAGSLTISSENTLSGAPTKPMTGSMSAVSIFNYALSSSQINYLYNNNAGGSIPNPQNPMAITGPTPIAYYPLGGSSTGSSSTLTIPNESDNGDTVFDFESGNTTFIKAFNVPVTTFTECTFSAWVNFESITGTYQYVMGMGSGPGKFMSISLWAGGSTWYTYDGSTSQTTSTGASVGKWYNVVLTQTGTTRRFYINGIEDANSPFTVNALAIPYNNLTLGAYNNSSSATPSPTYRLDGQLSNVQIWNSVLTSPEVATLYNGGRPYTGTQPQASNLKGWWKLNVDTSNWKHFSDTVASRNFWDFQNQVGSRDSVVSFSASDYIDYPYISLSGAFTVSTWVKSSDGKPGETSYGNYLSNSNQWGGGSNNDRNWVLTRFNRGVRFIGYNNTNGNTLWNVQTPQGGNDIPNMFDGEWHHVIAIWDGTTNSNGIKIFVDGILKGLGTSSGTNINTDNSVPIRAGSASTGFDYIGEQSNQQIWNIALTSGSASSVGNSIGGDAATIFNGGTPYDGTQPQASNLKGWWKLDNITTGIQDSSGNSNNGTNNGTVNASSIVSTLTGRSSGMTTANLVTSDLQRSLLYSSYSMDFDDASSQYVQVPNNSVFQATTHLTLSCWINTSDVSATNTIIDKFWDGTDRSYMLRLQTTRIRLTLGNTDGSGNIQYNSSATLSNNTWYHVAVTFNSDVVGPGSQEVNIYIDGQLDSTHNKTDLISSNNQPLRIGGGYNLLNFFDGKISNAAVWNTTLSENDILTIYNGGAPNDISSLSPVGWWSLSGDSYFATNWICPDLSANSNNGTSNGIPVTALVGNAPGSTSNGTGTSMAIPTNLQGNAPNSDKNAISVNMIATNRDTSVPSVS